MTDNFRWQVPGNANPFDSKLEDWDKNYMSQRSIGVLNFIKNKGTVTKEYFECNIKDYLFDVFNHEINKSNPSHFYRPLEFAGLIRNIDNNLSISIDGKNFLNEIVNENYDKAYEFYLMQLLKVSYPDTATKDIYLNLFPFRIIFKLLLNDKIPKDWFLTKIPYITTYEDLINLECIEGSKYMKWQSWVLAYLKKWNIIEEIDKNIVLTNFKKEFLNSILKNMKFDEMFFSNNIEYNSLKNRIKPIKRNQEVIKEAIKLNNFHCFFNDNHETFPTNNQPNFVEGHHIIPISLNRSFDENLDCVENI